MTMIIKDMKKYYVIGASIVSSVVVVLGAAVAFIELVVVRGDDSQWQYPTINKIPPDHYSDANPWKVTGSNPTASLSDEQFKVLVTFILFVTIEVTGLGLEAFVWIHVILPGGSWDEKRETQWMFAQFLFSILLVTTVGMALKGEFFCLPLLVLGMWKFGFPETLMYYYLSFYGPNSNKVQRLVDFMNGVGLAVHHAAAALLISTLLSGVVPPSRFILDSSLLLVLQHLFVLLVYVNKWLYIVIELTLEALFQWSCIANFQHFYGLHWTAALGVACLLVAHWLFVIAAFLDLLLPPSSTESKEATNHNVFIRGINAHNQLDASLSLPVAKRSDYEDNETEHFQLGDSTHLSTHLEWQASNETEV